MIQIENKLNSIALESYKTLRTNIQYSSFDNPVKSIVITSAEPGEGKSTTSINLALAFSQDDKRVIIIDCDLRKPIIHREFGITNSVGLTEFLLGKVDFSKVIHKYNKFLHIIPSGLIPPNPAEMLSSRSMERLLEELEEKYDYIILDTPPVNAVTDSKILSTKASATIIVVKYGETKKDVVIEAVKGLKAVNANIIGVVFNGEENQIGRYYKYYSKNK